MKSRLGESIKMLEGRKGQANLRRPGLSIFKRHLSSPGPNRRVIPGSQVVER